MADPMESMRHVSPEDRRLYERQYVQGADQFKRALDEYSRADEVHKKDAFRQVMEKALEIMNETARGLKRSDLLTQTQKLGQELETYKNSQAEADKTLLAKDIERAQKSIG